MPRRHWTRLKPRWALKPLLIFSDIKQFIADSRENWRRPEVLFILVGIATAISTNTWQVLLNNFAVDNIGFTGIEIGFLQSIREIPGFLSFAVVFLLLLLREQPLLMVSLLTLGVGTALTGMFPSIIGLYCLTVLTSIGFHYYEAANQSLILQWIDKKDSPYFFGQLIAIGSFAALIVFGLIYFARTQFNVDLKWMYLASGGVTILITIFIWIGFPRFPEKSEQNKKLVLRPQYWLFYCLTFMAGARRQIFFVFAGFMMVEKFGYSVSEITALFLINYVKTNMSVNGHVENALMIMNMNGQGVTSLPAGKIKTVLGALTSQHKCLTRSIFILSAPMAISILYKVVSIILDENLK